MLRWKDNSTLEIPSICLEVHKWTVIVLDLYNFYFATYHDTVVSLLCMLHNLTIADSSNWQCAVGLSREWNFMSYSVHTLNKIWLIINFCHNISGLEYIANFANKNRLEWRCDASLFTKLKTFSYQWNWRYQLENA